MKGFVVQEWGLVLHVKAPGMVLFEVLEVVLDEVLEVEPVVDLVQSV